MEQVRETHGKPALIVVDTVARSFGGGDENSTRDMGSFVAGCDDIRAAADGATVLLVHHTGHGEKHRARGAMALHAALDASYRMEKGEDGVVRLEAVKMKDAPIPEPMAFKLRGVTLPASDGKPLVDDMGCEVTSAVLDSVGYLPPMKRGSKGRGKNQARALEALERLQAEHERTLEGAGLDPGDARVLAADWLEAMGAADIPRARRHEVRRSLEEAGLVYADGFYVRLA
jgi:hypothetical protein